MQQANMNEAVLFDGRPALVGDLTDLLIAVVTLGLGLIYFWFRSLNTHYRVTDQRIVVEKGILSKRLDQVDLYRLNDYIVLRSLGQRIMGTGTLVLKTMDRTTPDLEVGGLKTDVNALYEKVRMATEQEKRKRQVRVLDAETHAVM